MRALALFTASMMFVWFAAAPPHGTRCIAQDAPTLMGAIAPWKYPGSKIDGATMADGATLKPDGDRAMPSTVCKTVMRTSEPISKVVEHYKQLLSSDANSSTRKPNHALANDFPRSVAVHDLSTGRTVAMHVILINTVKTSTTLVISRAADETETHILWTQYQKH